MCELRGNGCGSACLQTPRRKSSSWKRRSKRSAASSCRPSTSPPRPHASQACRRRGRNRYRCSSHTTAALSPSHNRGWHLGQWNKWGRRNHRSAPWNFVQRCRTVSRQSTPVPTILTPMRTGVDTSTMPESAAQLLITRTPTSPEIPIKATTMWMLSMWPPPQRRPPRLMMRQRRRRRTWRPERRDAQRRSA